MSLTGMHPAHMSPNLRRALDRIGYAIEPDPVPPVDPIAEQRETIVALARVWAADGHGIDRWSDTSQALANGVERLQRLERGEHGWTVAS